MSSVSLPVAVLTLVRLTRPCTSTVEIVPFTLTLVMPPSVTKSLIMVSTSEYKP